MVRSWKIAGTVAVEIGSGWIGRIAAVRTVVAVVV